MPGTQPSISILTPPGGNMLVSERGLPQGSAPDEAQTRSSFTFGISAQDGVDDLTVGGYAAIRDGVFTPGSVSVSYGRLLVTDYDPASGQVTVGFEMTAPHQSQPYTQQRYGDLASFDVVLTDKDGDEARSNLLLQIRDDEGIVATNNDDTAAGGVARGNVVTDGAPDTFTADGFGGLVKIADADMSGINSTPGADGRLTLDGAYGTLSIDATGAYEYTVDAGAPAGAVDRFHYWISDGDGDQARALLSIAIEANAGEPSPEGGGEVLTSDQYGDTLTGGPGNDTLNAGQGPDQLTGAGGGDSFAFGAIPWNAGQVTDFAVGEDRIDLSALLQAAGYTGSDPQADGYVHLRASGSGGTDVLFDPDADGTGHAWPSKITTLAGVSPNGLNWSQLADPSGESDPPPGEDHFPRVTALDGGALPAVRVYEGGLANGSNPDGLRASQEVSVILDAEDGVKDLYMGSQLIIDDGAFQPTSYTGTDGRFSVIFTSFDPGTGRLDFTYRLNDGWNHYGGHELNTNTGFSLTDQDGDTVQATFDVVIVDDAPQPKADTDTAVAGSSQPATGNVLTDATAGDEGDSDLGADRVGADGLSGFHGLYGAGGGVFTADPFTGPTTVQGDHGALTLHPNGDYSYALAATATAGAVDTFTYRLRDRDGDEASATLVITINAQDTGPGEGQVINSQGYGATLYGTSGDDTLNAGRGPDVLTGNGGADLFTYGAIPWNSGRVTDFTMGTDRLDLSAIFQAHGYAGTDPVADGLVNFQQDSAHGGALVIFDPDGAGPDYSYRITTLQDVSPSGLTWADLQGTGATDPPDDPGDPPPDETDEDQVLTSDQYGDTLTGGAGDDTLNAGQGPDQLTGAGGADRFVFGDLPWNAGHTTDFAPGEDLLDLSGLFPASYGGADPVADGRLEFRADGSGNTQVYVDWDGPNAGDWPYLVTTLDGVAPSDIGAGDWVIR